MLNLRYNDLKELPQEIIQLKNLKFLYLTRNQLQSLPQGIEYLQKLEVLDLERNQLNHLPEEIGYLPGLLSLNIANAGAGLEVPFTLCKSTTLEYLTIGRSTLVPTCFAVPGNRQLQIIVK